MTTVQSERVSAAVQDLRSRALKSNRHVPNRSSDRCEDQINVPLLVWKSLWSLHCHKAKSTHTYTQTQPADMKHTFLHRHRKKRLLNASQWNPTHNHIPFHSLKHWVLPLKSIFLLDSNALISSSALSVLPCAVIQSLAPLLQLNLPSF